MGPTTISWAAAILLAACAAEPQSGAIGTAPAACRAAGAQDLLGQRLDPGTTAQALRAAGGLRTRVIPPGGVVTLDHDPMRLNIEVDEAGTIRRMRCG